MSVTSSASLLSGLHTQLSFFLDFYFKRRASEVKAFVGDCCGREGLLRALCFCVCVSVWTVLVCVCVCVLVCVYVFVCVYFFVLCLCALPRLCCVRM